MKTENFKIQGMSCDGCRKYVEKLLLEVVGVSSVQANLEQGTANIEMNDTTSIEDLKEVFIKDGNIYSIEEIKN